MPVVQIPGFPGGISISDAQYAQYVAQGIIPRPTTTPTSTATLGKQGGTRTPTGMNPCELYENSKRIGQSAAVQAALKAKCDAYQQAQAFAASPAAPPPAAFAQGDMSSETQPAGMSQGLKIALIAGGAVLLLGGLAWFATRR